MRQIFVLVLFVVGAICRPQPLNSEHLQFLEKMLGAGVDINIVNTIVEEKARDLGITAQQHFQYCFVEGQEETLRLRALDDEAVNEFQMNLDRLNFDNVDTVLDVLKAESPKAHKAFVQGFNEIIADLGLEAATFVLNLNHTLLETLVNHSKLRGRPHRLLKMYGSAVRKVYAKYEALSEKAKIDFGKKTCIFTAMEISDRTGSHKGRFTELKETFNTLMAIDK